jgi:hypothetical protein
LWGPDTSSREGDDMSADDQPNDPLGTVRLEPDGGAVAVRGYGDSSDDLMWYVIDTGGGGFYGLPALESWNVIRRTFW